MNSDIDIVGNWKLNESSGSTAFDFSGKGNHASLNGPARSQDVPSLSEPYVTVTFNVDMDGVDVSDDGVSMVGVFGSPGDSPMSDDDGDGVWTRTVELEKNSSFHTSLLVAYLGIVWKTFPVNLVRPENGVIDI